MRDTFKEELEIMGPVRLRDVEEAQGRIVSIIRGLEEAGEIIIVRGGGDDIIV
jgi:flagellar motor switch protein FliG